MSSRLALAIISTIIEEAALAVIVLVGLPEMGISLHPAVLVVLMVAWAAVAVLNYRAGTHALERQPVAGLGTMVGSRGRVVEPLQPEGWVKADGELWRAKSVGKDIDVGKQVIVVGQDKKLLLVSPDD